MLNISDVFPVKSIPKYGGSSEFSLHWAILGKQRWCHFTQEYWHTLVNDVNAANSNISSKNSLQRKIIFRSRFQCHLWFLLHRPWLDNHRSDPRKLHLHLGTQSWSNGCVSWVQNGGISGTQKKVVFISFPSPSGKETWLVEDPQKSTGFLMVAMTGALPVWWVTPADLGLSKAKPL